MVVPDWGGTSHSEKMGKPPLDLHHLLSERHGSFVGNAVQVYRTKIWANPNTDQIYTQHEVKKWKPSCHSRSFLQKLIPVTSKAAAPMAWSSQSNPEWFDDRPCKRLKRSILSFWSIFTEPQSVLRTPRAWLHTKFLRHTTSLVPRPPYWATKFLPRHAIFPVPRPPYWTRSFLGAIIFPVPRPPYWTQSFFLHLDHLTGPQSFLGTPSFLCLNHLTYRDTNFLTHTIFPVPRPSF